ncbi:hypothetical+protein [Methylocapsa aurea]
MARNDLIINLVKASVRGDVADARAVAEAIAADERTKKHSGVADRISRVLDTTTPTQRNGQSQVPGLRVRDGSGGIQRTRRSTNAAPRRDHSVRGGRHHPGIPGRHYPVKDGRLRRNRQPVG